MEIFLKTAVRHSPVRTLNKVVRGWLKNLSSFVPRHFRRCEPTGILLGLPSPARKPEGLDCGLESKAYWSKADESQILKSPSA
jgi:hypothetical protein